MFKSLTVLLMVIISCNIKKQNQDIFGCWRNLEENSVFYLDRNSEIIASNLPSDLEDGTNIDPGMTLKGFFKYIEKNKLKFFFNNNSSCIFNIVSVSNKKITLCAKTRSDTNLMIEYEKTDSSNCNSFLTK